MSNNSSVTDMLTEGKTNIDTRMKYSKSQPSLTTSRSNERSWQQRQRWIIYSEQTNLIFFFLSFSLNYFILFYAERQISGFNGVMPLEPDCDLQGTCRDTARRCTQAARPSAPSHSSRSFPSLGTSPEPPQDARKALPTLQFYFNNDITLLSFI